MGKFEESCRRERERVVHGMFIERQENKGRVLGRDSKRCKEGNLRERDVSIERKVGKEEARSGGVLRKGL